MQPEGGADTLAHGSTRASVELGHSGPEVLYELSGAMTVCLQTLWF